MPRPKRTKVAPSVPAPRVRKSAKSTVQTEAPAQPPKEAFDDLYDVSDPEDRAARKARQGKKIAEREGTGAAGPGSATGPHQQSVDDAQDDGKSGLRADSVDAMLEGLDRLSSSPAVEAGRRERATPGIESSVLAISKFKRRPRQQSILGREPSRARSSSIESELAEDDGLMSVSQSRRNTSTLVGHKRRPRERGLSQAAPLPASSIALQMGTPLHVGSAMKIANFKRRAREPSVLGTAQKKQAQKLQYDDDNDEDDLDDFNPDDESTPLNLSKNKDMASSSVPSSSNPRKRKLSAVQVPLSQPSPMLPSPRAASLEEAIPSTAPRSEGSEGREDPEQDEAMEQDEAPLPSIERPPTPQILSDTMAPPRSSSSDSSIPSPQMLSRIRLAPSRGRRPQRNRTPPPRTQDSPISSPPSLTHSPNRPLLNVAETRLKKAAPPPSTLSTAQLQALLPKRRRRPARDTFDIPSSEDEVAALNPEDDELSHISARPRSRRSNALNRPPVATLKKAVAKSKQISKGKEPMATRRTYSSRKAPNTASDKENDGDGDVDDSLGPIPDDVEGGNRESENSQEMEQRLGKELKRAAKKFKEVDRWELEFEEITASSSSPKDAR